MERRARFLSKKDLLNRRTAAILTGAITAGSVGGVIGYNLNSESQSIAHATNAKTASELDLDILLNSILNETPFTNQRTSLELQYVSELLKKPTLEGIDKGFWVITDSSLRAKLLDQRWALREKGESGLKPLSKEKIEWAKSQNIQPEVLAIANDAYEKGRIIISELIESKKLRDDGTKVTPDEAMINPGGMAKLIDYETGDVQHYKRYAFTNIGDGLSLEEFKGSDLDVDRMKKALSDLCNEVSSNTGLRFNPAKIAGSKPVNPNDGGGAISIQFMPDNALSIYDLVLHYTKEKFKLNIFDVTDATVMAYVFLGRHESYYPRYGYRRGVINDQIKALDKWNSDSNEISTILDVAINYYSKFIDGKPEGTH